MELGMCTQFFEADVQAIYKVNDSLLYITNVITKEVHRHKIQYKKQP